MESWDVQVTLQQIWIPEQRKVVENGVVPGERHIVRQSRPGEWNIDVVHQVVVGVDHPVVQIGRGFAVVEEQHLAGAFVDLGMRRHAPVERERAVPGLLASGLSGVGVDPVEVAALVEARQRSAAVHHDVGARGILEHGAGAPAVVGSGQCQRFGQAGPQRTPGLLFGFEGLGPDEPVAVERLSVPETDDVQHGVAIEGVIRLECGVQRVLGVAQVETVEVGGDLTLHSDQVVGAPLGGLRTPRPGAVGVVVVLGQGGQESADDLNIHVWVPFRLVSGGNSCQAADRVTLLGVNR